MICLLELFVTLCIISNNLQQRTCHFHCLENVLRFTFQWNLLLRKVCSCEVVFLSCCDLASRRILLWVYYYKKVLGQYSTLLCLDTKNKYYTFSHVYKGFEFYWCISLSHKFEPSNTSIYYLYHIWDISFRMDQSNYLWMVFSMWCQLMKENHRKTLYVFTFFYLNKKENNNNVFRTEV